MKNYRQIALSICTIASLSLAQTDIVVPMNAIHLAKSCQEMPKDIKINLQKGDPQYALNWFIEASQALGENDQKKLAFLINEKNMFLQKRNFLDLKNSFENQKCMKAMDIIAESFREFKIRMKSDLESRDEKEKIDSEKVFVLHKQLDSLTKKLDKIEDAYTQKTKKLSTLIQSKDKKLMEYSQSSKKNVVAQDKTIKALLLLLKSKDEKDNREKTKLYEKVDALKNINRAYEYKQKSLEKQIKNLKKRRKYMIEEPIMFEKKYRDLDYSDVRYNQYFN